jgi:asparagine synthase (glutamine-hydrolysing)
VELRVPAVRPARERVAGFESFIVCGIAGRVNFLSHRPPDPVVVHGMCTLLAHRGPDGSGVEAAGEAVLGHRRLAIIDLTDAGRQPMASADRRYSIVFNGEIYNFQELRAQLEAEGATFRSRTDTEVVLHAYRRYGPPCLDRLRGMFAFAIWDAAERVLFLARDRVGKKPLFYRLDEDGIEFASEPKAFLANPGFRPEPDPVALSYYLTYQYVPAPWSAFLGVRKLPPAHYLLVRDGRVTVERYWRLRYAPKRDLREEEAVAELGSRLAEAVKLRLISDVPLGAFLSGGIDSGVIVALMARLGTGPVKTFSIGFEEEGYNELPYARMVAERYGTEHHEFVVRPSAVDVLPRLVWHYGEPYADSSAIPTYYLAQLTRRHVTVALNGDAGDENFAGYDRYVANVVSSRMDRFIPRFVRSGAAPLGPLIRRRAEPRSFRGRAGRFVEAVAEPPERRYVRWLAHFAPAMREELLEPSFVRALGDHDVADYVEQAYRESDGPDLVDRTLDVDVHTYLPGDLLVKVDIATMAFGLEGRSPFLDHEVMEFAASLPSHLKLRHSTKKHLLKRLAAPLLPESVVLRPKMGFGVPLARWFRGELRELAHDILLSRSLAERGLVRPPAVARLLEDHVSGRTSWAYQIWNLLMLELWFRTFVDERPTAPPADDGRVLAGVDAR